MDLTPGDFAMMTGLSAKALRLYAERGILEPASVDPRTGHRQYARSQLQQGMVTGLLRQSKVPLSGLAGAAAFDFEQWRQTVELNRHMEDFYLSLAERVSAFDPASFVPSVTDAPAVDWVGVSIDLDVPDDPEGMMMGFFGLAMDTPQIFSALAEALDEVGLPATEVSWTAVPEGRGRESRMLMARPGPLDVDVALVEKRIHAATGKRLTVSTGTLPHRQEITFTPVVHSDEILDEAASGHLHLLAFETLREERGLTALGVSARVVVQSQSPFDQTGSASAVNVFDVVPGR